MESGHQILVIGQPMRNDPDDISYWNSTTIVCAMQPKQASEWSYQWNLVDENNLSRQPLKNEIDVKLPHTVISYCMILDSIVST